MSEWLTRLYYWLGYRPFMKFMHRHGWHHMKHMVPYPPHTERKEKAAQSANAIETLAKELYDARVVCGDTFDSARKWRASAEAAETEVERLKGVLEMTEGKLQRLKATMVGYYNEG